MNKKRRTIALVIMMFLIIGTTIAYILSELYTESEVTVEPKITDAIKFKNEYESINNNKINDKTYRELKISKNNPMIYKSAKDIVEMINNKDTFAVYFGFSSCPWCRSVIEPLIKSAKESNINKIYYVDISDIRDVYELNDNNVAVKTKEGTNDYYKLLELLNDILDDYEPLFYETTNGKTKKIKIDEKRIYAPNVIIIKNGVALAKEDGISEKQIDAYQDLDEEMKCISKEKFNCLFEYIKEEKNACSALEPKC